MKKLLLFVIAGVLCIGLILASANKWHTQKVKRDKASAAASLLVLRDKQEQEARYTRLSKAYTSTQLECSKGIAAWQSLIAVQPKNTTPKPECGPVVVK
jgi:putative heme iron utilization protein